MSDVVDVAVVGAGPYGLSLAAHLRETGLDYRHFGMPMRLWRAAMPKGMFLKSQGFASALADPGHRHTLEAFCQQQGLPYASYGLPVPLDTFVRYGQWFQDGLGLDIEEVLVTGIAAQDGHFELTLANVDRVLARRVVVAVGVEHFAHVPAPLSGLPSSVCTHSSAHTDLAGFRGRTVAVIGAGQSALESAALLHESGAAVQVIARKPALAWNGEPLALDRPLRQRLKEPEAGLGSGWNTWFYSNHPDLFRYLPRDTRIHRARTAPLLGERCKILVVGRGDDRDRLEAAAARLGVSGHVIFGGFQPDTTAMLATFDLYVAASVQETFGLSVLEAMASGLPVLYTTCPALDGLVTSQARQVTGTAEALRAEIRAAVEAGPRPRESDSAVFEHYDIGAVSRRIDDLYERIMAERVRPGRRIALRRRVTAAQPAALTAPSLRSTGPLPLVAGAVLAQALAPDALPQAAGGLDSQGAPGE